MLRMTPRALVNIGLLVAVLGAGVAVFHEPEPVTDVNDNVITVPGATLQEIEIHRAPNPPILLQRKASQWTMAAPVRARLDETALGRLLDLTRIEASARLPDADLVRYGLDKPWARVRFGSQTLEFGTTNPITQELYVRTDQAVFTIPARQAGGVPSTPAKLLAHRMFGADDAPIRFDLPGFSLRHDGTRWQLEPTAPGLSQDDLIRWVDQWRLASSVITQPGKSTAAAQVTVELRDGRKLEFGVKALTPDLVLHRADEGLDYHLPAGMAGQLLASPVATTSERH